MAEGALDLIAHYGGKSLVQFILHRNTTLRNFDQNIDLDCWISGGAELISADCCCTRSSFWLSDFKHDKSHYHV
jgi:hypothetical protein